MSKREGRRTPLLLLLLLLMGPSRRVIGREMEWGGVPWTSLRVDGSYQDFEWVPLGGSSVGKWEGGGGHSLEHLRRGTDRKKRQMTNGDEGVDHASFWMRSGVLLLYIRYNNGPEHLNTLFARSFVRSFFFFIQETSRKKKLRTATRTRTTLLPYSTGCRSGEKLRYEYTHQHHRPFKRRDTNKQCFFCSTSVFWFFWLCFFVHTAVHNTHSVVREWYTKWGRRT